MSIFIVTSTQVIAVSSFHLTKMIVMLKWREEEREDQAVFSELSVMANVNLVHYDE